MPHRDLTILFEKASVSGHQSSNKNGGQDKTQVEQIHGRKQLNTAKVLWPFAC